MHLDDEQLQRFIDGELERGLALSLREHVVTCADCRERIATARRHAEEIRASLRSLDHDPPRTTAAAMAARARQRGARWSRRAAAAVLVLGAAGAAYAAPGSPLPALVRTVVERVGGSPGPAAVALDSVQTGYPAVAGIGVDPGSDLVILFTASHARGRVAVSLTDDREVRVRTMNGSAAFTAELDRLIIQNDGSPASFEIQIPRNAPRVEVRVAGERILLKEGSRVSAVSPAEDADRYLLPLGPGSR